MYYIKMLLSKIILHIADHIRVNHVHQNGVFLTELQQHPGDGCENTGSQIAEPIFQRKPSFKRIVIDYNSITQFMTIVCNKFLNFSEIWKSAEMYTFLQT